MKCVHCGEEFESRGKKRFCCARCKWTWNNHNRMLSPNVEYDCVVCGKHVKKYVSPSRIGTIDTLQFCGRTCKGKHQTGPMHPRWIGRQTDKDGYVYVHCKGHPNANKDGLVYEHRIVMERSLGRYLEKEEVVHHKNGVVSDNRRSNLELFANNGAHKKHHDLMRQKGNNGRFLPVKKETK